MLAFIILALLRSCCLCNYIFCFTYCSFDFSLVIALMSIDGPCVILLCLFVESLFSSKHFQIFVYPRQWWSLYSLVGIFLSILLVIAVLNVSHVSSIVPPLFAFSMVSADVFIQSCFEFFQVCLGIFVNFTSLLLVVYFTGLMWQ